MYKYTRQKSISEFIDIYTDIYGVFLFVSCIWLHKKIYISEMSL